MQIKIRYGIDEITKSYEVSPTIGMIRNDANLRAALGYGDNIKLLLNGVEMPDSAILAVGSSVVIETLANTKA